MNEYTVEKVTGAVTSRLLAAVRPASIPTYSQKLIRTEKGFRMAERKYFHLFSWNTFPCLLSDTVSQCA